MADNPTFAESTIVATRWIIKHAPDRLPEWLREHDKGLEDMARVRIKEDEDRAARLQSGEKMQILP